MYIGPSHPWVVTPKEIKMKEGEVWTVTEGRSVVVIENVFVKSPYALVFVITEVGTIPADDQLNLKVQLDDGQEIIVEAWNAFVTSNEHLREYRGTIPDIDRICSAVQVIIKTNRWPFERADLARLYEKATAAFYKAEWDLARSLDVRREEEPDDDANEEGWVDDTSMIEVAWGSDTFDEFLAMNPEILRVHPNTEIIRRFAIGRNGSSDPNDYATFAHIWKCKRCNAIACRIADQKERDDRPT